MPKVSVLMPVYNAENFLHAAVNSLLRQTCRDYEIVILNDGSDDSSSQILEQAEADKRVRVVSRTNRGVIVARNELLRLVTGNSKYIAWCDADDVYHPRKLEDQERFLDAHPELLGCGTWYQWIGNRRKIQRKFVLPAYNNYVVLFGMPVGFPTFMQRELPEVSFSTALTSAEDFEYLSRITEIGAVANLPSIRTYYRIHDSQESSKNRERQVKCHMHIMKEQFWRRFAIELNNEELDTLLEPRKDEERLARYFQLVSEISNRLSSEEKTVFQAVCNYRFLTHNRWRRAFFRRFLSMSPRDWVEIIKGFRSL